MGKMVATPRISLMQLPLILFAVALLPAGLLRGQEPVSALKGLDPTRLVEGREIEGSKTIFVDRYGYRYHFASVETKAQFEKDPAAYSIQLGGGCGRMGPLSGRGNPDRFHVHDKKIYIFASDQCREGFKKAPEKFVERTEAPPTGDAEAAKKGAALLEKVVEGFGGKAVIDGLKTLRIVDVIKQMSGGKEWVNKRSTTVRFPCDFRTIDDWGGESVYGHAHSVAGAVFLSVKEAPRVAEPEIADVMKRETLRIPIVLLAHRAEKGFIAIANGAEKLGDFTLEKVEIGYFGTKTIWFIDPATGRIHRIAYVARNGSFGDFVRDFSDFRTIDGLVYPFKVDVTFNGKPSGDSIVHDSIKTNIDVADDAFRKM